MSYVIKVQVGEEDLILRTVKRNSARVMAELMAESGFKCEVTREVEPRPVKFRNLNQEVPE